MARSLKQLAIVTPGILGSDYFREVGAILDAAAGGPPDLAAIGAVMKRHGLTPAPSPFFRSSALPLVRERSLVRGDKREVSIVVASGEVTITRARYAPGEQVAGPHVHHGHTDAFYVLEGELIFEIGREPETVTVGAGGFVAAPPGVVHAFRTGGDRHVRWLTIHAPDGSFAQFMRGVRDVVSVEWDISPVPMTKTSYGNPLSDRARRRSAHRAVRGNCC